MTKQAHGVKESVICNMVGLAVIAFSMISCIAKLIIYGESSRRLDGSDLEWSWAIIASGIEQIFWGCITGYILMKIASILRYHEQNSSHGLY